MTLLSPYAARFAFAKTYVTFVDEHVKAPFGVSVSFPPLLYTPHLDDPNPNQLHFLLRTHDKTTQSAESKAQSGQSHFEVEWPIIQRAINLASADIGLQVKTAIDGGEKADHLKNLILRTFKIGSFECYVTYPDIEDQKSDAETLLRAAVRHSASDTPSDHFKALGFYREASAVFSRYGLNYAAAMLRELAWQTHMAIPLDARDQSWHREIADDHLSASQLWHNAAQSHNEHSSNALRRGLNNALRAEESGSKLASSQIEQILLASASWFAQQGDTTKQTESLLYAILRQIDPLTHEKNLTLDVWTDVADLFNVVSESIGESDYEMHLRAIKGFAASVHAFLSAEKGKHLLQKTIRLPIYTSASVLNPKLYAKLVD